MRYTYTFGIWPDETWGFGQGVFGLFKMLSDRLEVVATEEDFERFRSEVSHAGITLRCIERVPYVEPEAVT